MSKRGVCLLILFLLIGFRKVDAQQDQPQPTATQTTQQQPQPEKKKEKKGKKERAPQTTQQPQPTPTPQTTQQQPQPEKKKEKKGKKETKPEEKQSQQQPAQQQPPQQQSSEVEQKRVQARELFLKAVEYFKQNNFEEALKHFEAAYNTLPHPAVFKNIADCLEKLGRYQEAVEKLEAYLKDMPQAEDRSQIEQRIQQIKSTPAKITIVSQPPGASIIIDGTKLQQVTPTEIEVPPGDHAIALELEGYNLALQEFRTSFGEKKSLEITLTPIGAIAKEEAVPQPEIKPEEAKEEVVPEEVAKKEVVTKAEVEEEKGPKIGLPVWISLGIAGAAFIAGVVSGSLALSDQSEFDDSGKTDKSIADRGETEAIIADVSFGIAAASAITGIVLFFLENKGNEKTNTTETSFLK